MSQISEHSEFCNISPPLTAQSAAGGAGVRKTCVSGGGLLQWVQKECQKGRGPHRDHKCKPAVQEADSDGVLAELVEFMFSNQFATARSMAGAQLPPAYVYAVETAIQMTLTELNENLREIYIEAYTQKEASDYIFRETAKELYQIFGSYQPELTAQDFFFMELGSAGIMRAYMAHPCDEELTLEKKLQMFLTMSLRSYHVPEDEIQKIIAFIGGMDIRTVSERVMHELFKALAMRFEFTL